MPDPFAAYADDVSAPARGARSVTPDDANPLPAIPKALYVGTGGAIVLRGIADAADTTWANVPSGAVLPIRAAYVRASGTSAANILALY